MTIRIVPLLVFAWICSCSFNPFDSKEKPEKEIVGWRGAGLEFANVNSTGGIHKITRVGNYLFAMQAYNQNMDASAPRDTLKPYKWRIWKTQIGTDKWDTIVMPEGNYPNEWVSNEGKLYVGTKYTGEVWSYTVEGHKWNKLKIPDLPESPDNQWEIYSMGMYKGELVICIVVYGAPTPFTWVGGIKDSVGYFLPGIGAVKSWPMHHYQEFEGYLYGIESQDGVFRWKNGMQEWEKLHSPRNRPDSVAWNLCDLGYDSLPSCEIMVSGGDERTSAIGVHDGKLYVGYADGYGLYQMDGDKWTQMVVPPDGYSADFRVVGESVRSILSYQDRLFVSGENGSIPSIYAPVEDGKVWFMDWKMLDKGWCDEHLGCPAWTWDMIGYGDTLYAAAWDRVAKLPMSQLDESSSYNYPKIVDSLLKANGLEPR